MPETARATSTTFEFAKFIPLVKVIEYSDGRHEVYGLATAEVPDRDGEVSSYPETKKAYQEWSQTALKATTSAGQDPSLGNVRLQHTMEIAGKATRIDYNDPQREIWVASEPISDRVWQMVKNGFITGYSHGGSYEDRWCDTCLAKVEKGKRCDKCGPLAKVKYAPRIAELSYVDSPCLPTARFAYVKADGSTELRKFVTASDIIEDTTGPRSYKFVLGPGASAMDTEPARELVEKCAAAEAEGVSFVVGLPAEGTCAVQAVIFNKSDWAGGFEGAEKWLKARDFAGFTVSESEDSLVYTQQPADGFTRTVTVTTLAKSLPAAASSTHGEELIALLKSVDARLKGVEFVPLPALKKYDPSQPRDAAGKWTERASAASTHASNLSTQAHALSATAFSDASSKSHLSAMRAHRKAARAQAKASYANRKAGKKGVEGAFERSKEHAAQMSVHSDLADTHEQRTSLHNLKQAYRSGVRVAGALAPLLAPVGVAHAGAWIQRNPEKWRAGKEAARTIVHEPLRNAADTVTGVAASLDQKIRSHRYPAGKWTKQGGGVKGIFRRSNVDSRLSSRLHASVRPHGPRDYTLRTNFKSVCARELCKYSPDQPRDEKGRWSEAKAAGREARSMTLRTRHHDTHSSDSQTGKKYHMEASAANAKAGKLMRDSGKWRGKWKAPFHERRATQHLEAANAYDASIQADELTSKFKTTGLNVDRGAAQAAHARAAAVHERAIASMHADTHRAAVEDLNEEHERGRIKRNRIIHGMAVPFVVLGAKVATDQYGAKIKQWSIEHQAKAKDEYTERKRSGAGGTKPSGGARGTGKPKYGTTGAPSESRAYSSTLDGTNLLTAADKPDMVKFSPDQPRDEKGRWVDAPEPAGPRDKGHGVYHVINRIGDTVGRAATRLAARRLRDKRDLEYGAVAHTIKWMGKPIPAAGAGTAIDLLRAATGAVVGELKKFDPAQPRSSDGRWTSGGAYAAPARESTNRAIVATETARAHNSSENNSQAFRAHREAGGLHLSAAMQANKEGDYPGSAFHRRIARLHNHAARTHNATKRGYLTSTASGIFMGAVTGAAIGGVVAAVTNPTAVVPAMSVGARTGAKVGALVGMGHRAGAGFTQRRTSAALQQEYAKKVRAYSLRKSTLSGLSNLTKYAPSQPRDDKGRWVDTGAATSIATMRSESAKEAESVSRRQGASIDSAKRAMDMNFRAARAHDWAREQHGLVGNKDAELHHKEASALHRRRQEAYQLTVQSNRATEKALASERRGGRGNIAQTRADHALASELHLQAAARHREVGDEEMARMHENAASRHRKDRHVAGVRELVAGVTGTAAAIGVTAAVRGSGKKFFESGLESVKERMGWGGKDGKSKGKGTKAGKGKTSTGTGKGKKASAPRTPRAAKVKATPAQAPEAAAPVPATPEVKTPEVKTPEVVGRSFLGDNAIPAVRSRPSYPAHQMESGTHRPTRRRARAFLESGAQAVGALARRPSGPGLSSRVKSYLTRRSKLLASK